MASSLPLTPGTVVADEFRIEGLIGRGGMGAVYRVEQLSTGTPRALKILGGLRPTDARARERFQLEARVAAQIASDHVVQVISAGFEGPEQLPWLVMELLDGVDLGGLARAHGVVPRPLLPEIIRQLFAGLRAAHRAGVVHRDLKPENVFVCHPPGADEPPMIKILDFGVAKLMLDGQAAVSATSTVGTPLWMAPEQLNRGTLTVQTDIWALGLLLFWALTGRFYWRAANEPAVAIEAVLTEVLISPLIPPSERAAELSVDPQCLPEGFDEWFARCVARDPARRFELAHEAGLALSSVLAALPDEPTDVAPWLPQRDASPLIPAEDLTSRGPGATLAATDRELYLSPLFRTVLRDDGILHVMRTEARADDLDAYAREADEIMTLLQDEENLGYPVLMDFRLAPPRNDVAFERATERYRNFMAESGRRLAVLVATMVGRLQLLRLSGSLSSKLAVFGDEQEALEFLQASSDAGQQGVAEDER